MASVKGGKCKRSTYRAKLATNIGPCVFCQRAVDDEIIYGKLYAIGDILCHYFCALLSCCLVQKVSEDEGLFGFRYQDILAEVERSKKHKCSYCNRDGANMGCCVAQCRKQFHLPCGREKNAVSLFYGNYKSFCVLHAPKQKVADYILPKVKLRLAMKRQEQLRSKNGCFTSKLVLSAECACVVCCERVAGLPAPQSFWPPCCARDAWLHRPCLQRMALSAGMHYLKCPLCNDKDIFYKAVIDQGYYVPDRDAAWELEQGAFADIYERPASCCAVACNCPLGRAHSADTGTWDLKLCILCGSTAVHAGCADSGESTSIHVCSTCRPAAPEDLDGLVASIESGRLWRGCFGCLGGYGGECFGCLDGYGGECFGCLDGYGGECFGCLGGYGGECFGCLDGYGGECFGCLGGYGGECFGCLGGYGGECFGCLDGYGGECFGCLDGYGGEWFGWLWRGVVWMVMEESVLDVWMGMEGSGLDGYGGECFGCLGGYGGECFGCLGGYGGECFGCLDEECFIRSQRGMFYKECTDSGDNNSIYVCSTCRPAAPEDLDGLVAGIESVQLQEQASEVRQGPIMPSRMSLRRTKRRPFNNSRPSSSRILTQNQQENSQDTSKIETSRLDLNLKSPKRRVESTATTPLSPMKVLEAVQHQVQGGQLVALRERLRRPAPRVIKAAIVNKILEEFLNNNLKDPKSKEPLKEWNSPKKVDITVEDCKVINIFLKQKFKRWLEENLNYENAAQELTPITHKESNESPTKALKLQYSKNKNDFICNFKHRHIETKVDSSSLRTAIDFARDAYETNCSVRKRRLERDASGGKRRRMSEGGGGKGRGSVEKQETLGSDERSKISERDHSSEEERREIYDCKDSRVEKTQEMSGNEGIGEEKRRTMSGSEDSSEEKRQRVCGGNSEEQRRKMSESECIGEGKRGNMSVSEGSSEGKRQKMLDSEASGEGKRWNMSVSEGSEERGRLIELNDDNEEQRQLIIERDNSGGDNRQGIDREEDSIEKRQIIIDREDNSENTEVMSERENVIEQKRHSITIRNVEISLMVAERDGDMDGKRQRIHRENGIGKNRRRLSRRVDKKRRRTINRKDSSEGKRQTIGEDIEKRRVISKEDSNDGKRQNYTDNVDGNENRMMEREGSIDEKKKMIEDCIEKETVDFETQNLSDVIDLSLVKTEIDDVRKRRNLSLKRKLKDNSDIDGILENKTKNFVTNADDDKISKKKKDKLSLKRKRKNSDAVLEIKPKKSVNNKSNLKNISKNNIGLKIKSTKGSEMVSEDNNENSKEDFVIKNKKRRLIKNFKNDCHKDIIDLTENTNFDSKTDKNNDLVNKVDKKRPESRKNKILSKVKVQYKKNKKLSIQNRGFKVKIKWRKEQLNLKITDERKKSKKVKNTPKVLKQYVLKYSPEVTSPKDVIMKPEDNTPVKRKYVKTEKRTDNLVQTNISSFFKSTPKST
ncbi:uncharacterized protein [Epargyreus clarus]|uniref:uncharacterized protein n=1 Tax=Epargyreus clarus TaxID=520877 RepID=UPI003C2B2C88